MSVALTSPTTATTRAVGAALAMALVPGDVVVLAGELGAGKTAVVQGMAAALGHEGRVTSPTFLLARTLPTDPPLVHADAWRLDHVGDVFDLGDDVLDDDVVTVLEWGDAVAAALPDDRVEVTLVLAAEADTGAAAGADTGAAAGADTGAAARADDHELPREVVVTGLGDRAATVDALAPALLAAAAGRTASAPSAAGGPAASAGADARGPGER